MVEDPVSLEERRAVAATCMQRLDLSPMPAVVDTMDDATNRAYSAWPERLYLIDKGGQVLYQGGPGPYDFDPAGLEEAIRARIDD